MGNRALNVIALLVLIAIVGFLVWGAVKKESRDMKPLVMSPEEFEQLETDELMDTDMVVITFNDNLYHVEGCPHIIGPHEKIILKAAVKSGAKPCPYCIDEEE